MLSTTNYSKAEDLNLTPDDVQELMETLNACDNALTKCGELVKEQDAVINTQNELIKHNEERIKELESETDNDLTYILVMVGGLLLGVVAAK